MEVYFICNNLFASNLVYETRLDTESKKLTRPLSAEGENLAKNISLMEELENMDSIYSSMYASSLSSAKYLASRFDKEIIVDENLNDCKIGSLGSRSLKMLKFMQNHDFHVKLNDGESLEDVNNRMEIVMRKIIYSEENKVAIYTHKRTVLGYLIKHATTGYNLDDDLIVEFNEKVIYNDADKEADIIKITYDKKHEIKNIEVIDI